MMFRKLYWVTEHVAVSGASHVTGVYTSIPDLIKHGLRWADPLVGQFRLTLTKLDSTQMPLGTWASPQFAGLEEDLQEFVTTDEFTTDQCIALSDALQHFVQVAV